VSQFPPVIVAVNALWEKIDEQTLSVAAAAVTFSGINTSFTFFHIAAWMIKAAGGGNQPILRINNDSAGNYDHQRITGDTASVTGARVTGDTGIDITFGAIGVGEEVNFVMTIAKPVAGEEAQTVHIAGPQATDINLDLYGGQWNNTAALISRLDILAVSANFDVDTRVLLEGAQPA